MTAICLLGKWTRVPALCQKRIRHVTRFSCIQWLSVASVLVPASVMSLGLLASNGSVLPLIWFPSGYRPTARECEAKLVDNFVHWINNTFDMLSVMFVLQQNGVPAHTSNRLQHFLQEQKFSLWSKNIYVAAILARRQPTVLRPLAAY